MDGKRGGPRARDHRGGLQQQGIRREAKPEGAGSQALTEWSVGAYLSLSGEDAAFGIDTKEGIELAVDEINKAGGVKGRPIKVIYEDDKSNPQEATNKVLQLIDRDKVVALARRGGLVALARPAASSPTRRRSR